MVAEPSEARLSGKRRPDAAAASCASARVSAGLGDQHVVVGIDLAHRPHPLQRQQDLALGDLAADQAGVAALGRDRASRLRRRRRRRPRPRRCCAAAPAAASSRSSGRAIPPAWAPADPGSWLQPPSPSTAFSREITSAGTGMVMADRYAFAAPPTSIYSGIYGARPWAFSSRIPEVERKARELARLTGKTLTGGRSEKPFDRELEAGRTPSRAGRPTLEEMIAATERFRKAVGLDKVKLNVTQGGLGRALGDPGLRSTDRSLMIVVDASALVAIG